MATLRALECLVALAEEGSMTKAASALFMSQSALSHQISSVEREIGGPVAERMKRGVRMTTAGHAMAEEAKRALEAAGQAVLVGQRVGKGLLGGRLRIACVGSMASWLLVPAIQDWSKCWPDVKLDLQEFTSSDYMVESLMENRTDLAVGPEPTSTTAHVEVLGAEEIVVVTAPDHPFAKRKSVSMAELVTQPLVHYHSENGNAVCFVDKFIAAHRAPSSVALRASSPRTAAELAGAGVGVTIVPRSALSRGHLGAVCQLEPRVHRNVVAITLIPFDATVSRFIAAVRQRVLPDIDTATTGAL